MHVMNLRAARVVETRKGLEVAGFEIQKGTRRPEQAVGLDALFKK